ncbi:hypothetical protein HDV63DRAFT_76625 [Trichoderma sp. SZMC 28014]
MRILWGAQSLAGPASCFCLRVLILTLGELPSIMELMVLPFINSLSLLFCLIQILNPAPADRGAGRHSVCTAEHTTSRNSRIDTRPCKPGSIILLVVPASILRVIVPMPLPFIIVSDMPGLGACLSAYR